MIFGLWNKKPSSSARKNLPKPRSTTSFGGMQVRELQARLEIMVDAVLNRQRSVLKPAQKLAKFSLMQQKRFLDSLDKISLCNQELAYQFCHLGIPALAEIDDNAWNPWIDELIETFNTLGLQTSIEAIQSLPSQQHDPITIDGNVAFTEVDRVLKIFLQALNGRSLTLATSPHSYTDTQNLYLPAHINYFPSRTENFLLYKALLIHQWAQTWFGTWRINLNDVLKEYADSERALQLFHWLETLRLDACLERELPGIAREMSVFQIENKNTHPLLQGAQIKLRKDDANVNTSVNCLSQLYPLELQPHASLYQGQLRIEQTAQVIAQRELDDRKTLQEKLSKIKKTIAEQTMQTPQQTDNKQPGFKLVPTNTKQETQSPQTQLEYDSNGIEITQELQSLLDSITQDLGEVPEHYLHTDELEETKELESETLEQSELQTTPSIDHESNDTLSIIPKHDTHNFSYDEWDHSLQRYRKNWCQLTEQSIKPVEGDLVSETLSKHRVLLTQLSRSFEALRQENQKQKREPFGEDIDIDAMVEAWSDTYNGLEASERLFIHTNRQQRNVAVMFMIDMSASTSGWINQVERESLILLCEALERLGDSYAIYGFSGNGNQHCQCFHIKDFDETYNDEVRGRIEGIQPQVYTRMGAAIRHLGNKLNQIEARTRLLITLSDGRPDDVGGYRGAYGIEDTRKALIEMRHLGIHPYCITIDSKGREYLPHMFGENDFIIINQVEKLPQKIADIYRRLTQ